jgi:hypothetical protein
MSNDIKTKIRELKHLESEPRRLQHEMDSRNRSLLWT